MLLQSKINILELSLILTTSGLVSQDARSDHDSCPYIALGSDLEMLCEEFRELWYDTFRLVVQVNV